MQDDALSRLLTFPNVLVTSHQAFFTAEALREIMRVTTENIVHGATDLAFLEGTRLA
jgi:D-lactate dehydrogenase